MTKLKTMKLVKTQAAGVCVYQKWNAHSKCLQACGAEGHLWKDADNEEDPGVMLCPEHGEFMADAVGAPIAEQLEGWR